MVVQNILYMIKLNLISLKIDTKLSHWVFFFGRNFCLLKKLSEITLHTLENYLLKILFPIKRVCF